jgi:acetyl esterase/lipase
MPVVRAALLAACAFTAAAATAFAQPAPRSMGSADPRANLVLDASAEGVRILDAVRLYPNGGGGFETWPGRVAGATEQTRGGVVFNVSDPSFQAFLPPAGRNTRTAVIIAPGGGFRQLSIASEGTDVARWLAARGIAAFVLKYRLVQQAGPEFSMMARMGELDMDVSGAPGVADGIEAVRQVRARAAEYGIDPQRIVMIGFSAGAHVAAHVAMNRDPALRPDYAAPIYGGALGAMPTIPPARLAPPAGAAPLPPLIPGMAPRPALGPANPAALPPMFLAMSQDDPLVWDSTTALYQALLGAGYRPEAHFFVNGGHGYGLGETRHSSRHFIEAFYWWLETQGLTRKPGDPDLKAPPPGPPGPPPPVR